MQRSNGGKRISRMIVNDAPEAAGLFTYAQNGVNYAIPYSGVAALILDQVSPVSSRFALAACQSNATATTIASTATPVVIAGAFQNDYSSEFFIDGNGRITNLSGPELLYQIAAHVTLAPSSGTDKLLSIYIAKNGTPIVNTRMACAVSSGLPAMLSTEFFVDLDEDDYIEVMVRNETDTTSVVASSVLLRLC